MEGPEAEMINKELALMELPSDDFLKLDFLQDSELDSESDCQSEKVAKLYEVYKTRNNMQYNGRMLVGNGIIDYLTAVLQPWLFLESLRDIFMK